MINIRGYNFQGPWVLGTDFRNVPGVYVVFTNQRYLDVGETDDLGRRINGDNHERKPQWLLNAAGNPISVAFLDVPNQQTRLMIEANLRTSLNPCCGER